MTVKEIKKSGNFESKLRRNAHFRNDSHEVYAAKRLKTVECEKGSISAQFAQPKNYVIYITGTTKVDHIDNAIEESKSILNLKDNWDDSGAKVVPQNIYDRAISFLRNYSNHLFRKNISINAPDIYAVKDGSINMEWKTKDFGLIVKFKNTEKNPILFYAEKLVSNHTDTQVQEISGVLYDVNAQPEFEACLLNLKI